MNQLTNNICCTCQYLPKYPLPEAASGGTVLYYQTGSIDPLDEHFSCPSCEGSTRFRLRGGVTVRR